MARNETAVNRPQTTLLDHLTITFHKALPYSESGMRRLNQTKDPKSTTFEI